MDDELIVQFVPKNTGLYTVRIFSDTRELCLPLAFLVDENCDAEGTSYIHPVKPTASYVRRSPALSTSGQQQYLRSAFRDVQSHRESRGGNSAEQSPEREPIVQPRPPLVPRSQTCPPQSGASPELRQARTEDIDGGPTMATGFTSDPYLNPSEVQQTSLSQPEYYEEYSPTQHTTTGVPMRARNTHSAQTGNRLSYISGVGSRRTSMADDDAHFSGDLHSTVPDKRTFDYLYDEKRRSTTSYGARRDPLAFGHNTVITPDTFKSMAAMIRKKPKKR